MALTSKDLYPPAAAFRTLVTKSGDVESSSSSSFEAKVFEQHNFPGLQLSGGSNRFS